MIKTFGENQQLSAAHLNEVVAGVNSVSPLTGSDGIKVAHLNSGGAAVQIDPQREQLYTPMVGRVTDTGPNEEANFVTTPPAAGDLKYNYWVRIYRHKNSATSGANGPEKALDLHAADTSLIVPAFSLSDYFANSRSLNTDDPVTVMAVRIDDALAAAPRLRYIIVGGNSSECWGLITGVTAGVAPNTWRHSWEEVERTADGWQDKAGGRSGTTSTNYAVSLSGFKMAENLIVRMYLSEGFWTAQDVYTLKVGECGVAQDFYGIPIYFINVLKPLEITVVDGIAEIRAITQDVSVMIGCNEDGTPLMQTIRVFDGTAVCTT
jgi:hypothetical protein